MNQTNHDNCTSLDSELFLKKFTIFYLLNSYTSVHWKLSCVDGDFENIFTF